MEKREPEEEFLPINGFSAALKELGVRDGVADIRAQQVCSQSFGGLVGHLQPILQNTDWEMLGRIAG